MPDKCFFKDRHGFCFVVVVLYNVTELERLKTKEIMTYKYNGHLVDVFVSLFGFVAYLDNDLEPLDISEAEYIDVITKGVAI